MPTVRLVASKYSVSNANYVSVTNASNMYNNTDHTGSYASLRGRAGRSSNSTYYAFIHGFNFSSVPSNATVTAFTVKIKAYRNSYMATGNTNYRISLASQPSNSYKIGNTTLSSDITTTTTGTVYEIPTGNLTWSTLSGYGDNFSIDVPLRNSSTSNSNYPYVYVYGAEIEVTYTASDPRTITSTLSGSGTINPSGATTMYDGESYSLTITPTDKTATVTVTNNGTDVSSELDGHYSGGTSTSTSQTAGQFTTQLSASGAAFYTGTNTQGNYFNYAVGHTAESPGSTSTSYNTYVKDNGSNTATGWAIYPFDFSGLPADADVTAVEVKCYGACESTTHDSTHKANITLYSGNTLKSTEQYFTSTSNSTITISSPGSWTREELQNANLHFEVAYYGGRLFGITWKVTYLTGGTLSYYTYTYTVSGNATIAVTIGGAVAQPELYVKRGTQWTLLGTQTGTVSGDSPLTQITLSPGTFVSGDTLRATIPNCQARRSGGTIWSGNVDMELVWNGTSGQFGDGNIKFQITSNSYTQQIGLFYTDSQGNASIYGTESIYKATGTGGWIKVLKAYKKINGSWVEQSDLTTVFSSGTNYVCGDS